MPERLRARSPRVLALASPGGHWIQLLRLAPAFVGCEVHWATASPDGRADAEAVAQAQGLSPPRFHRFIDAHRHAKLRLVRQAFDVARILLRVRPDVVVSTGASAGYFALRLGRLLGARTVWLDSVANAEELSLSGAKAGRYADLFLTQWPELARPGGPLYRGSVV
ncbi:MAG: UDP-N-acetylglucosamine transferase subunit ALG14 [Sphingomonadaceae bacterium]|uniref:glucuronosyltransferase n=1 Tax=Thermaurantiacus sp. TaxID=2820283 RepID=UPI00298F241F|nr:glucuronosyltransferase [Thermaurantiacus sp.]MCS6987017.1 UDP-N-acetylglucosamine transferase subunit ALG14 [Sphingomonadaceae bacterium]